MGSWWGFGRVLVGFWWDPGEDSGGAAQVFSPSFLALGLNKLSFFLAFGLEKLSFYLALA